MLCETKNGRATDDIPVKIYILSLTTYALSISILLRPHNHIHVFFFPLLLLIASFVICDSFFLASREGKILKNFGIFVFCYYDLVTTTKISKTK